MEVVSLKPGYKTTELALTVALDVAVLASALAGVLPPRWAAIAGMVSSSAYAVSRGLAKLSRSVPPPVAETAPSAPAPTVAAGSPPAQP